LTSARAAALQSFVTSSSGNNAAITKAQRVPQAIGVGFGYTTFDLRPIQNTAWSGAAPMEASLIYFVSGVARSRNGLRRGIADQDSTLLTLGQFSMAEVDDDIVPLDHLCLCRRNVRSGITYEDRPGQ